MKKLLLIALSTIATNLHAAEPPRQFKSGYFEISIHDLPEGSAKDLSAAIRAYTRRLDFAAGHSPAPPRIQGNAKAAEGLVTYPREHVYEVENAGLDGTLNPKNLLSDYSSLMIKPVDLQATSSCQLLGTAAIGMYNRTTGQRSGFARVFKCPGGDVLVRDMTFYNMRKVTIREQNNVDIHGIGGRMYGMRDKAGNSVTTLSWVSNDVDHLVQKTGVDAATREWLMQFARELVTKETSQKM